jgi:hypothetical protein
LKEITKDDISVSVSFTQKILNELEEERAIDSIVLTAKFKPIVKIINSFSKREPECLILLFCKIGWFDGALNRLKYIYNELSQSRKLSDVDNSSLIKLNQIIAKLQD